LSHSLHQSHTVHLEYIQLYQLYFNKPVKRCRCGSIGVLEI
jgi:hypothetical protein